MEDTVSKGWDSRCSYHLSTKDDEALDSRIDAKLYTHVLHESEVAAIEALENMTKICPNPEKVKTNMDKSGQGNYNSNVKVALAG